MKFAESTKIYDVLEAVNAKALSEKQGGGRPPFWEMVFWWTRKPLVGARATILASLLPDTVEPLEFLRMIGKVKVEKGKVVLDGTPHRQSPNIPEKYEGYFRGKKLLDPFAGFGSIPLEAMRLGLDVTAVELLPTAYVFLKAVLEYPAEYGKKLVTDVERWGNWVVERLREDEDIRELYDEDVAVYIGSWEVKCPHCGKWTPIVGNWWLARVKKKVKGKDVYTRLAFFKPVKDGDTIRVEIVDLNEIHGDVSKAKVNTRKGVIEIDGRRYNVPNPNIYARGDKAWCLHCGMEIRYVDENGNHYSERKGRKDLEWFVKWALKKYHEGDERFARQRLLVRVKVIDGDLVFEPCTDEDQKKLEKAKEKVRELIEAGDVDIPTEPVAPWGSKGMGGDIKTITWGLDTWDKHFNPRQLLTLVKLVKLIREVGKKVEQEKIKEGWSKEEAFAYAEAVATYLAIALCKMENYYSIATRWDSTWNKIGETLSTRGIAMNWNWVETNPFAEITGSLVRSLNNASNGLDYIVSSLNSTISEHENESHVDTLLDDATTLTKLQNEKFDLIVTDPPYADDVPYTELSDFYYVWLKRALSDSDGRKLIPRFHKDAFFKKIGAKFVEIKTQWQEFAKREISTNPGRFLEMENRNEYAERHFRELFTQAMITMRNKLKEDGIVAIYFAHTSFEAWALLLEAIRKAGFRVTGAYPTATESKDRVVARGKMTMDTSIVVICRPDPEERTIQLSALIPQIRKSAESYAKTLATKSIPGRDVLIGTMVGAIKEVTKYSRILTPAGEIGMKEILEKHVYPIVGQVLAEVYAGASGLETPVTDPYALFYLLAKIAFGGKGGTNPFTADDVITLCRVSKLDVNSAKALIVEGKEEGEEEEEIEEGSKVASSKTVRLAELKSKEPVKIRSFLLSKGISPDASVKRIRNVIDAYHLLLYYASAYPSERVVAEYNTLKKDFPHEVEEAVKLAKVVAKMRNGAEVELSRRLIQALGGLQQWLQ